MKKKFEHQLSHALKKELNAFPKPSPQLRNRLLDFEPQRVRKIVWSTAMGLVSTAVILFFICVGVHQQPERANDYFQPTKTVDLNELSFKPTKIVNLDE